MRTHCDVIYLFRKNSYFGLSCLRAHRYLAFVVVVVPYLSSLVSGFSKQMIQILKSLKIPGSLTRSSRILRLLAFILITILLLLIFREFHNPSKLFEPDNLKPVPNVIHFVHFINKEKEEVKPTPQIQDLVNNLDLC